MGNPPHVRREGSSAVIEEPPDETIQLKYVEEVRPGKTGRGTHAR